MIPEPGCGERLVEFLRGADRFSCELRDLGEHGVEAQWFLNETFLYSQRCDTRALAVTWAEDEARAIAAT